MSRECANRPALSRLLAPQMPTEPQGESWSHDRCIADHGPIELTSKERLYEANGK